MRHTHYYCHKLLFVVYLTSIFCLVYCFDPCSQDFEIVTDVGIDDCGPNKFFVPPNPPETCLPTCEDKFDVVKEYCNNRKCPPGFRCEPQGLTIYKCKVDENSCFRYIADYPGNKWYNSHWKPKCLPDGTWAAKQCKPDEKNGRCFCFDKQGNRIYGQAFARDAANMTCACSRKKLELMNNGSGVYVSLHCDDLGNYEPLQCNANQCWCVEPKTGEITAQVVPEKLMTYLPCYSAEKNGKKYLRQCESEEYGKVTIIQDLKVHGVLYANLPQIVCDYDGTYGPWNIYLSQVYCVWKDRSNTPYFMQLKDANLKTITCNCARDKKIYELAGMPHLLDCESSGEYSAVQKTEDGEYYCVDGDGQRKSEYFDERITTEKCADYL